MPMRGKGVRTETDGVHPHRVRVLLPEARHRYPADLDGKHPHPVHIRDGIKYPPLAGGGILSPVHSERLINIAMIIQPFPRPITHSHV